ncbi:MAG: hypothetical protein RI575_17490 [Balneolaceae bacterium]|nr:hypothetical protein [Balneolaceae bacterium]MDR9410127.1 hypothetical protein [Balneolaceae bacterium]
MMFESIHIDIRKLRDYCLNPHHPVGKHKARVFSSQLGIGRNDADLLKEKIIENMKEVEIEWAHEDKFGKRFSADLNINMKNRSALVRTIWIIKSGTDIPELVSCYIIT